MIDIHEEIERNIKLINNQLKIKGYYMVQMPQTTGWDGDMFQTLLVRILII